MPLPCGHRDRSVCSSAGCKGSPGFLYPHQPKPRSRPRHVGGILHVSITKERLIADLRTFGVRKVLTMPLSLEDAIEWVNGYPTKLAIPLDPACDDFDENGHCNGHYSAEVEERELEHDVAEAAKRGERGSQPNG